MMTLDFAADQRFGGGGGLSRVRPVAPAELLLVRRCQTHPAAAAAASQRDISGRPAHRVSMPPVTLDPARFTAQTWQPPARLARDAQQVAAPVENMRERTGASGERYICWPPGGHVATSVAPPPARIPTPIVLYGHQMAVRHSHVMRAKSAQNFRRPQATCSFVASRLPQRSASVSSMVVTNSSTLKRIHEQIRRRVELDLVPGRRKSVCGAAEMDPEAGHSAMEVTVKTKAEHDTTEMKPMLDYLRAKPAWEKVETDPPSKTLTTIHARSRVKNVSFDDRVETKLLDESFESDSEERLSSQSEDEDFQMSVEILVKRHSTRFGWTILTKDDSLPFLPT